MVLCHKNRFFVLFCFTGGGRVSFLEISLLRLSCVVTERFADILLSIRCLDVMTFSSNLFLKEFFLRSPSASPSTKPFFASGG